MTDSIEIRVARGAALLDEKLPGWVNRIELGRLNLASGCNCILGQELAEPGGMINGFTVGLYRLFDGDALAAAHHGFTTNTGSEDRFADLTIEWTRVILARRAGSEARDDR